MLSIRSVIAVLISTSTKFSQQTTFRFFRILRAECRAIDRNRHSAESMFSGKNILVTGANRGIGLEFVKQLAAARPNTLFAACRNPSNADDLQKVVASFKCVKVLQLDVTDDASIAAAFDEASAALRQTNDGLHVLINNAGILDSAGNKFPDYNRAAISKHFDANTIGTLMVTQRFTPLLKTAADKQLKDAPLGAARALIVNISSFLGSTSMASNDKIGGIGYRMSKASLNMATKCLASDLGTEGVLVVAFCPGWVRTDMGTKNATLSPEQSVGAILASVHKLDATHQGGFFKSDLTKYAF